MPSKFLLQELNKIKKLIPKLEPYWQREVRDLPDELKKELYQIKAIPPLTTGGLENVNAVLETLLLSQLNIEDLDKETTPSVSSSISTPSKTPLPSSPPPPKKSEAPTTTPSVTNLTVTPKTNLPAPSTKPQQVPMISQKPPSSPQTKLKTSKEIIIKKTPDLPSSPPSPRPSSPPPEASTKGGKSPDTLDFGPYYPKNIKNNH